MERLTLPPGRIDVWLARPDDLDAAQERSCLALLSEEERGRCDRFVASGARLQYLAAHALLRLTLSRYAAVRPEDWTFGANAFGRPHVETTAGLGLHFNLSHTDGLVAVAVAADPLIGVDVESMRRAKDLEGLARSVFSGHELAAFSAGPDEAERRDLFFALWTLKEAYIKARGLGFSLDLDSFAFDVSGPAPSIRFSERCPDDPARWRFWRFRPTPDHFLAIAGSVRSNAPNLIWLDKRILQGHTG